MLQPAPTSKEVDASMVRTLSNTDTTTSVCVHLAFSILTLFLLPIPAVKTKEDSHTTSTVGNYDRRVRVPQTPENGDEHGTKDARLSHPWIYVECSGRVR